MRWDDASNTPSVPFFCRCYTSLSCASIITPCKRHGSCRRMLVMVACLVSHRGWLWFWMVCQARRCELPAAKLLQYLAIAIFLLGHCSCAVSKRFKSNMFETSLILLTWTMIDLPRFLRLITCFHQDTCEPLPGCDDGNPRFRELSRLHRVFSMRMM